jgi:RimJ/RimL family protein N-acetyltransferase
LISLVPISEERSALAVAELDRLRVFMPRTAGSRIKRLAEPPRAQVPLTVRRRSGGALVGLLTPVLRDGPRYVELTLFAEPSSIRAGEPLEAYLLYARHLLAHGTDRVEVRILSGDREVLKIMEKVGLIPDAVLRQAAYAAGDFHDLLVCSVTDDAVLARLEGRLYGERVLVAV